MAHTSGLNENIPNNPLNIAIKYFKYHKTLRGPRSGMIFCRKEYIKVIIDNAVFKYSTDNIKNWCRLPIKKKFVLKNLKIIVKL